MSFIKSINNAFVKCFDFKTRATRSEFWYFYLFTTVVGFIGLQFDQLFELQILGIDLNNSPGTIMLGPMYIFLYFLFMLPSIALYIRRLHDTNRSGWWYLISFTIIGYIPLLYWWCVKGEEGENRFGLEPRASTQDATMSITTDSHRQGE